MSETKVTSKFQTTIPVKVRDFLGVEPVKEVEWNIVKGIVVVDSARKIEHPVQFLTSQIKLNVDVLKLVKNARADFK